jgi:hypothetical protein
VREGGRELGRERSWQRIGRYVIYLYVTLCVPPPRASLCFEALPALPPPLLRWTLRATARRREEEEEDLFVFNDTMEGPRAPAVKPGRITIY